ncbi:MAG: alkaline phosphatase family protein, partial [Phycisphaerae bacterium]|nr:alkaline phosphatase family protein [Phycisphaerae bacterium]
MSDLKKPGFMVLSIDGVPIGLIRRMIDQGDMPNLGALVARNGLRQMRSVQPTVSCVAWASYATGVNPAKHGIYGFIDRREDSWGLSFPNAAMFKSQNLWQILSKAGKRVFGMNVPSSYPPAPVNGVLIGGFLAPT